MTNSPDPSPSTTFFKNAITTLSGITVYLVALLWLMAQTQDFYIQPQHGVF